MKKNILARGFRRKGITTTPWGGDVIIVSALSIIIMITSHFILQEAWYASVRTAFAFFCIFGIVIILKGFSTTNVCIKEGVIKTWCLYKPLRKTFRIDEIVTLAIKSNDWCRNNIILYMKDGKQHKLSVNEVDEFILTINSVVEQNEQIN